MKVHIVIKSWDSGYLVCGVFTNIILALEEIAKQMEVNSSWWSKMGKENIWVNSFQSHVLSIIEKEVIEKEQKSLDAFSQHLKYAKAIVESWPEWKRNVLGKMVE